MDSLLLVLLCAGVSISIGATIPFVTTWRTILDNENITLPLTIPPATDLAIDWEGQGASIYNSSTPFPITYKFPLAGLHNVTILGDLYGFRFNSQGDAAKLVDILDWGDGFFMGITSSNAFAGCVNLKVSAPATSQPQFLVGATLSGMFANSSFNSALTWNLTNVVSLEGMFAGTPLNQTINFANTTGVTNVMYMFKHATRFNRRVIITHSANIAFMDGMFFNATSYNQNMSFNTINCVSMSSMFAYAESFNKPLNFNTGNVGSMTAMFQNALSFNQPLIFNTTSVKFMDAMFANAVSFNQAIDFDMRSVGSMVYFLAGAVNFNQPLNLSTSNVTLLMGLLHSAIGFNQPVTLDTRAATLMKCMFCNATSFNQPVTFNTDAVLDMSSMFQNATAFNQPVNFSNTTSVTTMESMFEGAGSFNQPINFQADNLNNAYKMFSGATSFNQPVVLSNAISVTTVESMFEGAVSFNQPINFRADKLQTASKMFVGAVTFNQSVVLSNTTNVTSMDSMFEGAVSFNQPINFQAGRLQTTFKMFSGAAKLNQPVILSNTSNVATMESMFEGAVSFNQPINFQADSLQTTFAMFSGATSFNQSVVLSNSRQLQNTSRMFANVSPCFNRSVSLSSTANVTDMFEMFVGVPGFQQDLRGWDTRAVASCAGFCQRCGLPSFPMCGPCGGVPPQNTQPVLNANNMSVCNLSTSGICGIVDPVVDLCKFVNVSGGLQVSCLSPTPPATSPNITKLQPTPKPVVISPLFNITQANDNMTDIVFTLPIDIHLFHEVGKVTQSCSQRELSCEWQDPDTLEFRQSGCAVSQANVDMGSGVVGTQCTCTHLTVFAIVLRSDMRLTPLCHAQEADYVLIALYAALAACLLVQLARVVQFRLYKHRNPSLIQHLLLLVVCMLRVAYLVAKPVISSLALLVLLGLLPSAIALSLFIQLLLMWAGLQSVTMDASPFARFRNLFIVVTLLVFLLVAVLVVLLAAIPDTQIVQGGSYAFAVLTAIVCFFVLLSGLGLRRTLGVLATANNVSTSKRDWRSQARFRLLIVTVGLSVCLFVVACLWVAAIQTDILVSSAATLATTTSFYVCDWLSLCLMTWLFSKGVKQPEPHTHTFTPSQSNNTRSVHRHNASNTSTHDP